MLKVSTIDSGAQIGLVLYGALLPQWIAELRTAWIRAQSSANGRQVVLSELADERAKLSSGGVLMRHIIRQIISKYAKSRSARILSSTQKMKDEGHIWKQLAKSHRPIAEFAEREQGSSQQCAIEDENDVLYDRHSVPTAKLHGRATCVYMTDKFDIIGFLHLYRAEKWALFFSTICSRMCCYVVGNYGTGHM